MYALNKKSQIVCAALRLLRKAISFERIIAQETSRSFKDNDHLSHELAVGLGARMPRNRLDLMLLAILLALISCKAVATNDSQINAPGFGGNLSTYYEILSAKKLDTVNVRENVISDLGLSGDLSYLSAIGPAGGGTLHTTVSLAAPATPAADRNTCPNHAGDPITISTGSKVEDYIDFALPGEMGLRFERYYQSKWQPVNISGGWTTNLDFAVTVDSCDSSACYPMGDVVTFSTPTGRVLTFNSQNPQANNYGTGGIVAWNASSKQISIRDEDGMVYSFIYTQAVDPIHPGGYWGTGSNLTSIKNPSGITWAITHPDANTTVVTHTNGQSYRIARVSGSSGYGASEQINVTDPAGNVYVYQSTGPHVNLSVTAGIGVIQSVTFPGSPSSKTTYKYLPDNTAKPYYAQLSEVDYNGVAHDVVGYDGNQNANMTSMADGSEKVSVSYGTGSSGKTATITNALGHVNVYQYNSQNLLVSIAGNASVHCLATYASTAYDSNWNISSSKDNNGNITQYTYAETGLLQKKVEAANTPAQRVTDYTWDSTPGTDRLLSVKIEGLSLTNYTYDAHNRLASVKIADLTGVGNLPPLTTTYAYTLAANGMVTQMVVTHPSASNTDKVTTTYDAFGRVTKVSDGLGHGVTYNNYDALGNPGSITNVNGDTTTYTYDTRSRVTSVQHVHAWASNTGYSSYDTNSGLPSLIVEFNNEQTRNTYDAYFKLTKSVWTGPSGASITTAYSYDANGDVTKVIKTLQGSGTPAVSQTMAYDELGRLLTTSGNHGQKLTYGYDPNGNRITVKDALGHATTTAYDALNRPYKVTDPNGYTSQATYGLDDKVHTFTDNRQLSTGYSYDGFGNLWELVSPDTGTTTYAYDTTGHRTSMTRYNGISETYGYDAIYRIISISAGGETHNFAYDNCANGIGQLCAESTPNTSSSYNYTPEGWLAETTVNSVLGPGTEDYAYDGLGRMIQIENGTATIQYTWTDDQVSNITAVTDNQAQTVASNIAYDVLRHPVSWTYGNGLQRTQAYDSDGRIVSLAADASGTTVQNLDYTYDSADRVVNIANNAYPVMSQGFAYDNVGRVISMTGPAAMMLSYDANGNRTQQNWSTNDAVAVSAFSNHIASRGSHLYSYDVNGNRSTHTWGNSTLTYTYDGFNRMRTASRNVSTSYCETSRDCPDYQAMHMTYYYSARGQRMSKTDPNGETVWYTYLPSGQLGSEMSTQNGYNNIFIWAGNR